MDKILNGNGFNQVVKGRYGYFLYNKNDVFVGKAIEMYGEYSEAEVELFRDLCEPGFHIMDLGANMGALTLPLAQIVGKYGFVYAFEPQQVVFQSLCANMALNSIDNVQCFPYAVSDADGYGELPHYNYNIIANYGAAQIDESNNNTYRVKKVSLDNHFHDIKRIDFIKMDIEGMEAEALRGATMLVDKFRPIMYVENDKKEKSKELIKLLQSLGYLLYWHMPPLYNPDNYAGESENIYGGIATFNMICVPQEAEININGPSVITDSEYHPLFTDWRPA